MDDIQSCFLALFKKLTANVSPWTSWEVVRGWPERDILKHFSKPIIYLEPPFRTGVWRQQAGKSGNIWEMIVGAWDDRKTGGIEEIQIISAHIIDLFNDPQTLFGTTFDVTLGGTTYTDTTLTKQKIRAGEAIGPRTIQTEDLKEFRVEFTVTLQT